MSSKWRTALIVALRLAITLLYVPAILVKLRHPGEWGHVFTTWGYPAWGPVAVSVVEIIGLITLWISTLAMATMTALAIILIGATGTWLIHGPRATPAYPATILALIALLAVLETRRRRVSASTP